MIHCKWNFTIKQIKNVIQNSFFLMLKVCFVFVWAKFQTKRSKEQASSFCECLILTCDNLWKDILDFFQIPDLLRKFYDIYRQSVRNQLMFLRFEISSCISSIFFVCFFCLEKKESRIISFETISSFSEFKGQKIENWEIL